MRPSSRRLYHVATARPFVIDKGETLAPRVRIPSIMFGFLTWSPTSVRLFCVRLDGELPETHSRGVWQLTLFLIDMDVYITYIHTYIHTYIQTYIQTRTRTYIHTYMHTYIYTYNMCVCARVCARVYDMCVRLYVCACVCMYE